MNVHRPIPGVQPSGHSHDHVLAMRQPVSLLLPRDAVEIDADEPAQHRRRKLWELSDTLHCSIIGTCLSTGDLRLALVKLDVAGAETATDHDLHASGVLIAGMKERGGKRLQKALDFKHAAILRRFQRAQTENEVAALWDECLERGDIPGAYWAVLTHPLASQAVAKKAFQDVHMLSHLVGAANRADLRRLRELEAFGDSYLQKIEKQRRQIRDGFAGRDATIRRLEAELVAAGAVQPASVSDDSVGRTIDDLEQRLAVEASRRSQIERRRDEFIAQNDEAIRRAADAERERDALRLELAALERALAAEVEDETGSADLGGLTVLYCGGRPHQVSGFKAAVERANARFLHHDGGVAQNAALLPSLIAQAGLVLFPVDCISHNAVATIKRLCARSETPYRPLRTASLASLHAALFAYAAPDAAPQRNPASSRSNSGLSGENT